MTLALLLRVEILLVPFYHRANSHASPELLLKMHQAIPETQLGEMLLGTQKEASFCVPSPTNVHSVPCAR